MSGVKNASAFEEDRLRVACESVIDARPEEERKTTCARENRERRKLAENLSFHFTVTLFSVISYFELNKLRAMGFNRNVLLRSSTNVQKVVVIVARQLQQISHENQDLIRLL